MLNSLLDFLKKYRTNYHGFENAKITANELAKDLDVEQVFVQKRYKKAKKMFYYESNNDVHRNNVTSASAERSFSKLKLIKTYLRSTMTQIRLSGLAMLSIENEMASELNFDSIIDAFAAKKIQKKNVLILHHES
ncbi:hypothetical protein QTP88_018505 [Uroleucon formosanum]